LIFPIFLLQNSEVNKLSATESDGLFLFVTHSLHLMKIERNLDQIDKVCFDNDNFTFRESPFEGLIRKTEKGGLFEPQNPDFGGGRERRLLGDG
jgi:hypothetical protein